MTDEGKFEELAMAILREAVPEYERAVHTGMNAAGKTIKSPVDGLLFVPGANPPHVVAFHHSITAKDGLKTKWLLDPAKVVQRKATSQPPKPGDLPKTLEIVKTARLLTPDLKVTVVLTSNEDPDDQLVLDLQLAGRNASIEIDLWPRSRLCHFLDHTPTGQYLRARFLGVDQELLSRQLMIELCHRSLVEAAPPDNPAAWVHRSLDVEIASALERDVTLLAGPSGTGKTVACYRRLRQELELGGMALVISVDVVASAVTLEQAVVDTLSRLHPTLSSFGPSPLSFGTEDRPLLLLVEDINKAGNTHQLIERLASWAVTPKSGKAARQAWRLLCPVWPSFLATLESEQQKRVHALVVAAGAFSSAEATQSVLTRALLRGEKISGPEAERVAALLGNDPLLIALYEAEPSADAARWTIGSYVENSLTRLAAQKGARPAGDYLRSLLRLGAEMLRRLTMEPTWDGVRTWLDADDQSLIAELAHQGNCIRFGGSLADQNILFRHDRVQHWIVVNAAIDLVNQGNLTDDLIEEPYFTEVMGDVVVQREHDNAYLSRLEALNPLALFHALRSSNSNRFSLNARLVQAIKGLLARQAIHGERYGQLRWEALGMLAETALDAVPDLVAMFPDHGRLKRPALAHNGDLEALVLLCEDVDLGTTAPWKDAQIAYAKVHYKADLLPKLDALLRSPEIREDHLIGALRFAGYIGDPSLVSALRFRWDHDVERAQRLTEYLWAACQCALESPETLLGPICDVWASLPDEAPEEHGMSDRLLVIEYSLRFAFRDSVPDTVVIDFLIGRSSDKELSWYIMILLHGIDHPKAVAFVVDELARISEEVAAAGMVSPFAMSADDEWRRAQENGRPMSVESRQALLAQWSNSQNPIILRQQALRLWSATVRPDDLGALRQVDATDALYDRAIAQRLRRSDSTAIPTLVSYLETKDTDFWWYQARRVWSHELTEVLDLRLSKREPKPGGPHSGTNNDYIESEMLMRLPTAEAERLLVKHWDRLSDCTNYVQTALYVATKATSQLAAATIATLSDPKPYFSHITSHMGIRTIGHPGIVRQEQILALVPYLQHLEDHCLSMLWEECNRRGWYDLRRQYFDPLGSKSQRQHVWTAGNIPAKLDELVSDTFPRIRYWWDEVDKQDIEPRQVVDIAIGWLERNPTAEAMALASELLNNIGSRQLVEHFIDTAPVIAGTAERLEDLRFGVRRRSLV